MECRFFFQLHDIYVYTIEVFVMNLISCRFYGLDCGCVEVYFSNDSFMNERNLLSSWVGWNHRDTSRCCRILIGYTYELKKTKSRQISTVNCTKTESPVANVEIS
jgi:hypothetical protein